MTDKRLGVVSGVETIRVLAGTVGVADFTVNSLARRTGVSRETVDTVLRRHPRAFRRLDPVVRGRRRPQVRWQLRPEAIEEVVTEVGRFQGVQVENLGAASAPEPDLIEASLTMAADSVSRALVNEPEVALPLLASAKSALLSAGFGPSFSYLPDEDSPETNANRVRVRAINAVADVRHAEIADDPERIQTAYTMALPLVREARSCMSDEEWLPLATHIEAAEDIAMTVRDLTFHFRSTDLISLLGRNLYVDPDIFLRERIRNAHDSIVRRELVTAERNETDIPPPVIRVVVDREAETIEISDNGCGLTYEEIAGYLSTIGQTANSDELRRQIQAVDRTRTVDLIGQFGVGLLSAFIVADQVTMITKAPGHQAFRWESLGGEYQLNSAERREIGTSVTLHLRSEHHRYLDTARVRSIIRTYADFLGIPVFLNDETAAANAVTPPWNRSYSSDRERRWAYYEFWEEKFTHEISLHTFAVDSAFEWDDVNRPDGKGHGRVQGVLAITDRHGLDANARGTVELYIKRMFIGDGGSDVLPPWARFVQGVLECDELTPNAARDNVVRNAALAAMQRTLGWLVVRELTDLSERDHQRFVDIMRWHSYDLLAMSAREDYEEFYRALADLVPLDSDQGPITVAEYLRDAPRRSDGSQLIYYIAEPGSANQYFLLARARGIRVFDCAEPFAERFVKRYAETWPERVQLHRLDMAGSETIFEPLTEAEREAFAELEAAYSLIVPDMRCVVVVSRFRPVEMPAVLTKARERQSRRELDELATDPRIPASYRDLLKRFRSEQREPVTLHLNADNPTVQKLAARGNLHDQVSRQVLVSLYDNALMLQAGTLRLEDVQAMFVQRDQEIELMLSLAAERDRYERDLHAYHVEVGELLHTAQAEIPRLDPYVSCFVAMPLDDDRATGIYQAVRAVLEDHPYFWRVVRADDTAEQPGVWPNLKTKLLQTHCYIAILTGSLNPNVLIETGRMEALQRPLLLLRDAAAAELPANLSGLPYEELRTSGNDLIDEVRNAIVRQDNLRNLHGSRYLSEIALMRYANLDSEVSRKISRLFPTWDEFIQADTEEVARQLGVNRLTVLIAKASLEEVQ